VADGSNSEKFRGEFQLSVKSLARFEDPVRMLNGAQDE
jgi:hypothetical protein